MTPAFKEWSLVCSALARGDTVLILRKGGIAEDAGTFAFQYPHFFLLPTRYHAAAEKWLWPTPDLTHTLQPDQPLTLTAHCQLIATHTLHNWSQILRLQPFHGWSESVLRERFTYAQADTLHAAIVRTYNLAQPWTLPYDSAYAGCKSWVELPDPPSPLSSTPAIPDPVFAQIRQQIEDALLPA